MKQKINLLLGLIVLLVCTSPQASTVSSEAFVQYELSGIDLEIVEDTSFSYSFADTGSGFASSDGTLSSLAEVENTQNGGIQTAYAEGELEIGGVFSGYASAFAEVDSFGDAEAEAEIGLIFEVLEDGLLNIDVDGSIIVNDLLNTTSGAELFVNVIDLNGETVFENQIDLFNQTVTNDFAADINVFVGYEVEVGGFTETFATHPIPAIPEPEFGLMLLVGLGLVSVAARRKRHRTYM